MKKLKVGQILFEWDFKERKITRIGRKYFYVENCRDAFDIETLKYQHKDYSQFNTQLYISKEEIEIKKKRQKTLSIIESFTGSSYQSKLKLLSDDDLEVILNVIEKYQST